MAEASIPVDFLNPGQVFACLGFMEAAEQLCGSSFSRFEWDDEGRARFWLRVPGVANPFHTALAFISEAEVVSLAPSGSSNSTDSFNVPTVHLKPGEPFPFLEPESCATLPALLRKGNREGPSLIIDHWGDSSNRDNVKFWAGSGGYPGAAMARDAIDLVRDRLPDASEDPLNLAAGQTNSFRFDWRRDYIALDAGFSLNRHAKMTPVGFPLVELFAAVGLSHARPKPINKLKYAYGVIGSPVRSPRSPVYFDPIFMRAALGAARLGFSQRSFCFSLGWPGKEGQARCITHVVEDNQ